MRWRREERGSVVIESLVTMGLALLLVVVFANIAVNTFIWGVAHSAVDQGVRAGARENVDSVSACEARVGQVLGNFAAVGSGASVSCSEDGDVVRAALTLTLPAWAPYVSDFTIDVGGLARKERS